MLQNQSIKVLVATTLGGFVGSLIALQFNAAFWWVGMLVGGVIGYLLYEPSRALSAARVALTELGHDLNEAQWGAKRIHEIAKNYKVFWWHFADGFMLVSWFLLIAALFNVRNLMHDPQIIITLGLTTLLGKLLWAGGFVVSLMMGMMYSLYRLSVEGRRLYEETAKSMLFKGNAPVVLCYWLPLGIRKAWPHFVKAAKTFFRLIHSDLRLLCGIDAALGAGAGYCFHNALIGAIVGGLLGVVNFEFVSKRWLKIEPTTR